MIVARKPRFDWSRTPLHWLPGDPHSTHMADVLHLLLPAGERWFCRVFRQAAPLIHDPALAAALDGFIRQEASHARAHAALLEHLAAHGLDPTPYTDALDRLFDGLLADRGARWLRFRIALIAAIEHWTSVLGAWIVEQRGLDDAGADPEMLRLLRWHGAEEVEHRAVAFDVARALGVGYLQRQLAMALAAPVLVYLWYRGVDFLMRCDPLLDHGRASWRAFVAAGRRGTLPGPGYLVRRALRYLSPRFHPRTEGSTERALAFLEAA